MNGLLAVELRRLLARRVLRFVAAMTVLGMVLAGAVLFARSHRGGPEFLTISGSSSQAFALTHFRVVAEGLSGLFIAMFVVLGATSAGAEWNAGTVTTQLTWEPRRVRLVLAKTLAAAIVSFAFFWLAEALLFGVLTPAAVFHGSTAGLDAEWARSTAGVLLRASAVVVMASAVGHSVAWFARSTAVSVGVVLGYVAVVEPLLRATRPGWEPWFAVGSAVRFITANPSAVEGATHSTAGSALLVASYTAAAVALAVLDFRSRDVT